MCVCVYVCVCVRSWFFVAIVFRLTDLITLFYSIANSWLK